MFDIPNFTSEFKILYSTSEFNIQDSLFKILFRIFNPKFYNFFFPGISLPPW